MIREVLHVADGFDQSQVCPDDVRAGFLLRLPFRLRGSGLRRYRFEHHGHRYEVCLRNTFQMPHGTPLEDALRLVSGGQHRSRLFTDALVLVETPVLQQADIDALRASDGGEPRLIARANAHLAVEALNHVVLAYHTSTRQMIGYRPLRPLTLYRDLLNPSLEGSVLCPAGQRLSDDVISALLDRAGPSIDLTGGSGCLDDLPEADLEGIPRALSLCASYVHYEFAFRAKDAMVTENPAVALVLAVTALEGSHAAFLRHEFGRLYGDARSKHAGTLLNNLLREQGIFTLLQLSPMVFKDEDDRPDDATLKACLLALEARNAIVHASTDAQGSHKFQKYTEKDLGDLYSAVLSVYDAFVSALERRLPPSTLPCP